MRSGPEAGAENKIVSKVGHHDDIACFVLDIVRAYCDEIDNTTYYSVEFKHRPSERDLSSTIRGC